MTENYPWYSVVSGSDLRQGDIIFDCPVIVPTGLFTGDEVREGATLGAQIQTFDVVVMSQSCDLENGKLELVLVCPHWTLEAFSQKQEYFKTSKGRSDLQRGNVPGYHLINRCDFENWLPDLRVVDFRSAYGLPFAFLKGLCLDRGSRLRLLPPYREHLSQAFARFFMRVGLPSQVDLDGKKAR